MRWKHKIGRFEDRNIGIKGKYLFENIGKNAKATTKKKHFPAIFLGSNILNKFYKNGLEYSPLQKMFTKSTLFFWLSKH